MARWDLIPGNSRRSGYDLALSITERHASHYGFRKKKQCFGRSNECPYQRGFWLEPHDIITMPEATASIWCMSKSTHPVFTGWLAFSALLCSLHVSSPPWIGHPSLDEFEEVYLPANLGYRISFWSRQSSRLTLNVPNLMVSCFFFLISLPFYFPNPWALAYSGVEKKMEAVNSLPSKWLRQQSWTADQTYPAPRDSQSPF